MDERLITAAGGVRGVKLVCEKLVVGLGLDSMSRKCLLRKFLENFERYNMFVFGHQSAYVINWMVKWKSWSGKPVGGREN